MSKKSNAKRKIQTQIQEVPQQPRSFTTDAFQNLLARMGVGTPSMIESTAYPLTRLSQNYTLMNSLYRSHWIVRRIIDVIPEDMCKNWYQVSSQLEPDHIERIKKLERKTSVKPKILETLKWARLYGGAAAIMMIDGHEGILDQPLNIDMVMPGSFKGLLVVDRWSGLNPSTGLVIDINDPEFGLPETYQVTNNATHETVNIHHSRVLRFIGRDLPFWEKQSEVYWGASEIEHIYDELRKRDNTSWNIANLVFRANLNVLQMEGLDQVFATGNDKVKQDIYNTVQAQNWLMNNFSMYILGEKDKFDTKSYTFAGLSDIYENFMCDISGAAEIPVTKLFGRSPAGMNATGESDMQNYYDVIEERQESYLRPVFDKLLPVLFMSELGAIPDDLDYKFSPIRRASDEEKAELGSKITGSVIEVFNAGLISQQIALKELRQLEEITDMWSNITDDDIANADANIQQPMGEEGIPGMGEGMEGLFGNNKPDNKQPENDSSNMLQQMQYQQHRNKVQLDDVLNKMAFDENSLQN